jgi:hypothetical protein
VSFQITILKVLAGHPEGRASVADVKQYVAVLMCSGPDWSRRMKFLAARAPGLDVFSSSYVLREPGEWRITDAGRSFLASIELPAPTLAVPPTVAEALAPLNVVRIADYIRHRSAA